MMIMCTANGYAQLVINELMQSNIDCVMDDIKEYPDSWVELYNPSKKDINLRNYRIGETDNPDDAWKLPNITVEPGQYVLIYCDTEAKGLHTDFRLDSGKGMDVYLFRDGNVMDKITGLEKQPAPNIAYGRENDGSDIWGYQLTPTPKAKNAGKVCDRDHILGEPVFSENGYVTEKKRNMNLKLSLPDDAPEGTIIRYTIDGSEPTLTTGTTYTKSIRFSNSRVIRARLFCEGWLSPRSTTQSYIVHGRDVTLPVISISLNQEFLNDSVTGIFACNQESYSKNNWRRPLNIEFFFEGNQNSQLNQLCEMRISGSASRGCAKKSMALYAHKRFGTKRFDYEFFPDQKPGVRDFKSLVLRNAGNDYDYLYMRDAIIQRSMAQYADLDWQAWRPAIIYINGSYYGMLNIRERANGNNIYTNYNGLEDIDLLENNDLKEGTKDKYIQFQTFYKEHGHTLAEYAERMDWEEYINLMIMNLYFNNQDFPGNNNVMWRPRAESGRWRWIAKDTDFGIGLYDYPSDYNTIKWINTPDYDSDRAWANKEEYTRLFHRLMEDKDFYREFIDRCCIYMGDFLNERGVRAIWDPMYEMIKYEYPYHRNLINRWWPKYDEELNKGHEWVAKRTDYFYAMLGDYYELGKPFTLTVNKETPHRENLSINFNGIDLHYPSFEGKFFADRQITLKARPAEEDVEVIGWKIIQTEQTGAVSTQEIKGDVCSLLTPSCNSIAIETILGGKAGITTAEAQTWNWLRGDEGIVVVNVPQGISVRLYDTRGMLLFQTTATGTEIHIPAAKEKLYLLKVGKDTIKLR